MSEDLIKRSDAIKAVWGDDINPSEDGVVFEAQSHIDRDIRLIPSSDRPNATEIMNAYHEGVRKGIAEAYEAYGADRPQGEWVDDEFLGQYRCSECDYYSVDEFDYCPNCGARMKGADDD